MFLVLHSLLLLPFLCSAHPWGAEHCRQCNLKEPFAIVLLSCPPGSAVQRRISNPLVADNSQAGLGVARLDQVVHRLIERGVAGSTLAAYNSGKRLFCTILDVPPLQLNVPIILLFVAYLFTTSLSHQTIRSYLGAIRHLQIESGLPDPAM